MSSKLTFKGKTHRVQIAAWDFLDSEYCPPEKRTLNFSVSILPASAHKSTSFSTYGKDSRGIGKCLYYGPSFRVAWSLVRKYDNSAKVPLAWKKYAIEWNTLARMAFTNSPKMPTVVQDGDRLREWVGIGWIDIKRQPSGREPIVIR